MKHGHYFLNGERGFFLFNTRAKRGRAILDNGKALDITFKSHPKIVKAILKRGERIVSPRKSYKEEEK
jgi:hypothetical protein